MEPGARPSGGGGAAPGQPREYKLVMLGAGGVGKSGAFLLHSTSSFSLLSIEDAYKIRIRIDDEPANLDILDTAGQAEFTAMRDQYMRAGEGFIICYSITDCRSFHEVRDFKQLIYRVRRTDETPVVLVGNKSDLTQLRQVSKEEGSALAREFGCPFFETSAAFRYYIDDVFHALVREIRRKEREAVMALEKKSKPRNSVWKRLKSPFQKKKESVT
uniref:small monomeric GTPase n=1 Tax=Sphenodon punctatus TaxID=8508 RepID=A0A8D0HET1_SPHPU